MPSRLVEQFLSELSEPSRGPEMPPEVLIAEANHRIANNLTMIAGLCRLQATELGRAQRSLSPGEASALLQELSGRIEAVSRLHRLLSETERGTTPELGAYLCDIALTAVSSMSRPESAPRFSAEIRDCSLQASEALSLGFIVGELVTNSVKYAHPASVVGEIRLRCERTRDGATIIEVSDDGVGFPEGFDPGRDGGLGMRLIRSLASHLNADLEFEQTDLGLTARLSTRPRRCGA